MANKERNDESRQLIDWRKKGLGWVPDYPDIRDYQLDGKDVQVNGRLRKEELTGSIESIAENIIEAFQALKSISTLNDTAKASLDRLEEKISRRIFDGVNFGTVKVHKILRKGEENPEEVLKLKSYLSILGYRRFLDNIKLENFNSIQLPKKEYSTFKDFISDVSKSDTAWLAEWLNSPEFDDLTESLVKAFQSYYISKHSSVFPEGSVDGIVGLEFYTALNELFTEESHFERASRVSHSEERKIDSDRIRKPIKFRVVSTPSLIPEPIFKVVFEELRKRVVPRIEKETPFEADVFRRIQSYKNDLQEEENEVFNTLFPNLKEAGIPAKDPEIAKRGIIKTLDEKLRPSDDKTNQSTISFGELFYNEFVVIDPIVSLIVNILHPLARYKRFEDAVKEGLEIFDYLLLKETLHSSKRIQLLDTIEAARSVDSLRALAIETVEKVKRTFLVEGINLVLNERLIVKTEKLKSDTTLVDGKRRVIEAEMEKSDITLCFYFLLMKFLSRYSAQSQSEDAHESKRFNKRELFEVSLLGDSKLQTSSRNSRELNLFPPSELAIPTSTNFYKLKHCAESESVDERLFFFLPGVVDLSFWCSAIEDQGSINSCTAFAGIALMEYFSNRSSGKYIDASSLFLYKVARNLMGIFGDVGASLRETLKAMILFGVPPEKYWPYQEELVDEEPPAFCYSFAQNYQAIKYFRLDYAGITRSILLAQIKAVLAAGFPCMFGFTIYSSAYEDSNTKMGWIPVPSKIDKVIGGHAVVAVGYSDYEQVSRADGEEPSQGAILVRNSWGTSWGRDGYGWLPYDYILHGLTANWWSLLKAEWFEQDSFGWGARNTGVSGSITYP